MRNLASSLKKAGLSRDDIYRVFFAAHLKFQQDDRIQESDTLGDVMDMLTGWYGGSNFDV